MDILQQTFGAPPELAGAVVVRNQLNNFEGVLFFFRFHGGKKRCFLKWLKHFPLETPQDFGGFFGNKSDPYVVVRFGNEETPGSEKNGGGKMMINIGQHRHRWGLHNYQVVSTKRVAMSPIGSNEFMDTPKPTLLCDEDASFQDMFWQLYFQIQFVYSMVAKVWSLISQKGVSFSLCSPC